MKVRHRKDRTEIKAEDLDDLWTLKTVLEEGDEIFGATYRRVKDTSRTRADAGERVRVRLGIRLESAELHRHSRSLRLLGRILESSDPNVTLGSYHTLEARVGEWLTVKKTWKGWQLEVLREAERSSRTGVLLIVSIEEGEAEFAVLRRHGIEHVLRISRNLPGKRMEERHESTANAFYQEVADRIVELSRKEGISTVVLCGPGFSKEKAAERLRDQGVHALIEPAGCGGRAGIQEVLKRGVAEKVAEESKVAEETRLVEELLKRIARDEPAAYGPAEVERAAALGAVDTLLVTYSLLAREGLDDLLKTAKAGKARVLVVSQEHEAGEKLQSLGGIAALLRYRV